ncbi:heavy-metal-associated domain-containing protein [Carnobacterium maltaromaticum]|nr:heavy-metal-associated domain-containing protein [Carnobacterium maltaromaticum]
MMKEKLIIDGMKCEGCAKNVFRRLHSISGVESVSLSLEDNSATIDSSQQISQKELDSVFIDSHYKVSQVIKM